MAATGGTLDASGTGSGTLKFTGTFTATDPAAFNLTYTSGSNVATNTTSNTPRHRGWGRDVHRFRQPARWNDDHLHQRQLLHPEPGRHRDRSSRKHHVRCQRRPHPDPYRQQHWRPTKSPATWPTRLVAASSASANPATGTWHLSGTNAYTGATSVTAGTLVLAHNSAAGSFGRSRHTHRRNRNPPPDQLERHHARQRRSRSPAPTQPPPWCARWLAAGTYDVGSTRVGSLKSDFTAVSKPDTTAKILAGTNSSGSDATLKMKLRHHLARRPPTTPSAGRTSSRSAA